MKKFILKLLAFALVPIAIYLYFLVIIPVPEELYFCAYNKKMELLENTPTPRVVFVGGSNLAFALDCKRVSDSLNIPVINTALHAGMGFKFILDDVATYLRKGDIVYVAPEYPHFFGQANGESLTLPIVLKTTKYRKLHLLNWEQWKIFLKGIPELNKYAEVPSFSGYKSTHFNEYGDEVYHLDQPGIEIPKPGFFDPTWIDEGFCKYFAEKLKEIEEMGCKVIVSPCACRQSLYDSQTKAADLINQHLTKRGYPFNVHPSKHALPDSCAYDTDYHLNKQGVEIFTGIIIEELKKEINQ